MTLGRQEALPVADALRARGVPFVFVTGDDLWRLPEVYEDVPRCGKPVDIQRIAKALFAWILPSRPRSRSAGSPPWAAHRFCER